MKDFPLDTEPTYFPPSAVKKTVAADENATDADRYQLSVTELASGYLNARHSSHDCGPAGTDTAWPSRSERVVRIYAGLSQQNAEDLMSYVGETMNEAQGPYVRLRAEILYPQEGSTPRTPLSQRDRRNLETLHADMRRTAQGVIETLDEKLVEDPGRAVPLSMVEDRGYLGGYAWKPEVE